MRIEVKQESDGKFGLYVADQLIGTSKLHCDATLAGEIIRNASKPTWSEQRSREAGWAAESYLLEKATRGTGEMGQ